MSMVWFVVTFAVCILWKLVIQRWFKERSLPIGTVHPPMPPVSTIFGHEELNWPYFHCTKAAEWAKEYGPVYRLTLNFTNVVVLSNAHSIKTFCKNNDGLFRSGCFIVGRDYNQGIVTLNGECWTANRRYCLSVLRDLGFAKSSMEQRMTDTFREFEACIGDTKGQPVSIRPILISCFTKNVTSFFYPNGLLGGDKALCKVTRILDALKALMMGGTNNDLLPTFIRNLLYYIPSSRNAQVERNMNELDNFIRDQIESYKSNTNENDERGFIEAYMKKIEEARQEPLPKFQERFLVGNVKSFLIAGIFSTTNTTQWHLLNFATRRDVQSRVQREIDEVIGTERLPTWEDRRRMHYTMACIWEILRWKPTPPLGVPREEAVMPRGGVCLNGNLPARHISVTKVFCRPRRAATGRHRRPVHDS
ncbi:cytochrome P450 2J4-like isoform X2 [Dermacentor albipictus]|uniref:cytochrome P450 2J4-like isoform X2 n=1 Tax=Dermacentor albipictus TaxID=60249 RepID=UPI0038FC55CB